MVTSLWSKYDCWIYSQMLSASTSGLQPDAISIHLWTSVKNWPYKHLATKFACLMDSWDSSCSCYHRKKVKVLVAQSCLILCDPMDWQEPARLFCPWNTPGKNTGVGSHSFLQGIFPTQRSNPGLPPCRQILYHLRDEQNIRIIFLLRYSWFTMFITAVQQIHTFSYSFSLWFITGYWIPCATQ